MDTDIDTTTALDVARDERRAWVDAHPLPLGVDELRGSTETCFSCRLWVFHDNQWGRCLLPTQPDAPVKVYGECDDCGGVRTDVLTDTRHDHFCGEWQARKETTP